MKHNNEDIRRLDGDIYELPGDQFIDMSKVVTVKPGAACYEVIVGNTWLYITSQDPANQRQEMLEFIEVWKHWKRENERSD